MRDRLTPKEMQIVALIVQGCKNKDIAEQLHTKEQVIKNYLRKYLRQDGGVGQAGAGAVYAAPRLLAEAAAKVGDADPDAACQVRKRLVSD